MLSFSNESSIMMTQDDHPHPYLSQMSFLTVPLIHNQSISESYQQMQTPNFYQSLDNIGNQHMIEVSPDRSWSKNSLVNKLISTFEDLGLDVEYLDESETQDQHHSIDFCRHGQNTVKELGKIERKCNQNQTTDLKFSGIKNSSPHSALVQKMKLMKEYCLLLRGLLSSMLTDQEKIRAQCQEIINNTVSAFEAALHDSMRIQRASADKEQQISGSEAELQLLSKAYDQLSNIIEQKQQKINELIIQNEHLNLENSMLHFQLQKFAKKHEKCKDVKEQYEIILYTQHYYQRRVNELQEERHEYNKKIECLQWSLIETHKNLSQKSEENQIFKEQLEQRYRTAFEETAQKLRKKIEAQTYYKLKHEYHFNIQRIESRLKHYRSIDQQHLRYIKGDVESQFTQHFQSPLSISDSSAQQAVSNVSNFPLNTSLFLRIDSNCYDSSKLSGKNAEDNEKQLERLLKDIKLTKESTAQNSQASSQRGGFRRHSFSRPRASRV